MCITFSEALCNSSVSLAFLVGVINDGLANSTFFAQRRTKTKDVHIEASSLRFSLRLFSFQSVRCADRERFKVMSRNLNDQFFTIFGSEANLANCVSRQLPFLLAGFHNTRLIDLTLFNKQQVSFSCFAHTNPF